jgi:hypothetical protein
MDVGSQKMEGVWVKVKYLLIIFLILNGCASSKKLQQVDAQKLAKNEEFENQVRIFIPEESVPKTASEPSSGIKLSTVDQPQPLKVKKAGTSKKKEAKEELRRQPELEPEEGFEGRRPKQDPFRVGEKVVHRVHYFNMTAGTLEIEVKPFAEVNGKKSYNFFLGIQSSPFFSNFYSVKDSATTLMDFERLIPSVFSLHVREKAQLREARAFFDQEALKAKYWEKKVTDKDGEQEKKLEWDILPFSQNVYSTVFYMRTFQWEVGKEVQFRVAHDNDNLVYRGKALRKEKIKTDVGEFSAIVIKPEFELKGKFQPSGDNYIWVSDDDRKFILKIESKIKIGTLVSEVIELNPGIP